jgi:hypothetical protein
MIHFNIFLFKAHKIVVFKSKVKICFPALNIPKSKQLFTIYK